MNNELSKHLVCICLRGGIEVWVEKEKTRTLISLIEGKKMIQVGGNVINSVDITGIFEPKVMEERTRRKNGEFQCLYGFWHQRNDQCAHRNSDRITNRTKNG